MATYYKNSTSQMLYAADEIGKKGIIQRYADGEWIIPTGACSHQLIEHAAVHNTCGDDGNTLYYECSICHHYFSDAAAENEVEENSWVIPADPSLHVFTNKYDSNGFGKCDRCGHSIYSIFEPAQYNDENNRYSIYNVGQLYWFADKASNGTSSDEGYPFNAEVSNGLTKRASLKIVKNCYAFVEEYIDKEATKEKEHIGYIVDHTASRPSLKYAWKASNFPTKSKSPPASTGAARDMTGVIT